jgi:hypothetical protein
MRANENERFMIDRCFSCLCDYSLKTLLEQVERGD